MLEAIGELVGALRPVVEAAGPPLQVIIIVLLWRIERRVYKLEITAHGG